MRTHIASETENKQENESWIYTGNVVYFTQILWTEKIYKFQFQVFGVSVEKKKKDKNLFVVVFVCFGGFYDCIINS